MYGEMVGPGRPNRREVISRLHTIMRGKRL